MNENFYFDTKRFHSVPAWVRKLCVDLYGVYPDDPAFILPYEFSISMTQKIKEVVSQIPQWQIDELNAYADMEIIDNNNYYIQPLLNAINLSILDKQDTLIAGANIKTINGNTLVGSGDLTLTVNNELPALVFDDVAQLSNWFLGTYVRSDAVVPGDLQVGQLVFTIDPTEEDYWVIQAPVTGFTQLTPLDTTIDLSSYYSITQVNQLLTDKASIASVASKAYTVDVNTAVNDLDNKIVLVDNKTKDNKLKVIKVEQDLDNVKKVIESVNSNQLAIVNKTITTLVDTLPKNAAEAPMKFILKGYSDGIKDIVNPSIKSVGKNLFDCIYTTNTHMVDCTFNLISNNQFTLTKTGDTGINTINIFPNIKFKELTQYTFKLSAVTEENNNGTFIRLYYTDGSYYNLFEATTTNTIFNYTSDAGKNIDRLSYNYVGVGKKTTITNLQIEQGTIATAYEQHKSEEITFFETFRSVGTVADELVKINGIWCKKENIKRYVLQENDFDSLQNRANTQNVFTRVFSDGVGNINYSNIYLNVDGYNTTSWNKVDNVSYYNNFVYGVDKRIYEIVPLGTYTTLAQAKTALVGTVIYYQLETPIIKQVDTLGKMLYTHPAGTIIQQNLIPDVAFYTDKMSITHLESPIKTLTYLAKIDFETGLETILVHANATVAGNGLSFTHAGLASGDLVYFKYESTHENNAGQLDLTYYNSDKVKLAPNGKAYKLDWTVNDAGVVSWGTVAI